MHELQQWERDNLAVLLNALDSIPLSDSEIHTLTWLSGWERDTVGTIAGLIRRARAAGPVRTESVRTGGYSNARIDTAAGPVRTANGIDRGEGTGPGADRTDNGPAQGAGTGPVRTALTEDRSGQDTQSDRSSVRSGPDSGPMRRPDRSGRSAGPLAGGERPMV